MNRITMAFVGNLASKALSSALLTALILLATRIPSHAGSDDSKKYAEVYLTTKDTEQRLAKVGKIEFDDKFSPIEKEQSIFIDPSKTFQTILGIGGALTDASAETFYKLPKDKQQEILRAYYDPQSGIGYSLGRTHIHSCDFSSESYTYVKDGDKELKSFDIAHDLKCRIPFIKQAIAIAGTNFTLFISPWSRPLG